MQKNAHENLLHRAFIKFVTGILSYYVHKQENWADFLFLTVIYVKDW
jgi:hypothetical protein